MPFSSTRETELIQEQLDRLRPLADKGGIPKTKIIELDNQLRRQEAVIGAHRQDLLTRGLNPEQIKNVSNGQFVSTVEVVAPPLINERETLVSILQASFQQDRANEEGFAFEVGSSDETVGNLQVTCDPGCQT